MLKAALAFAPLLAGYLFATTWYRTRYLIKREDPQKVYFRAAFWGIWLFLLAFAAMSRIRLELGPFSSFLGSLRDEQVIFTDSKTAHVDLAFWLLVLGVTLGLGTVGGYLLNWLFAFIAIPPKELLRLMVRLIKGKGGNVLSIIYGFSKRSAVKHAIHAFNSDLDILLLRAMEENMPVSITMGHGKVYVGYVTGSIKPGEKIEMLRILPLVSGYREGDAMRLKFTTWYIAVYQQFTKDNTLSHLRPELFEVVLPLSELKSINLFDVHAYQAFQKQPA